jgi:DNA-binding beta-propeller fold protein YncE
MSKIVVYDRMTNTPPTAAMSAPKRVIGGERSFLEYVSSVYVDPASGDIFAINNDTMLGMPVFGRDAVGNVAPKRRIERPHTSFAIAASEKDQELFLTIQDDHAVVVYGKNVKDKDGPIRIIQGGRTGLADPHGITVDPTRNEIFVANWGQRNERPPLSEGGGGGYNDGRNFPVGRTRVFPASGKIEPASITVYPTSARGDAGPLRVIKGPKTQLNWATALAVHPDRGELFVANDVGDSVTVFRADASGNVAPIRVLKGPRSMIKHPTGLAVDLKNNELWVANFGGHSATVYPIAAQGDAPPLRVIRSAPVETESPMLSNPHVAVFDSKRKEILVAN